MILVVAVFMIRLWWECTNEKYDDDECGSGDDDDEDDDDDDNVQMQQHYSMLSLSSHSLLSHNNGLSRRRSQ